MTGVDTIEAGAEESGGLEWLALKKEITRMNRMDREQVLELTSDLSPTCIPDHAVLGSGDFPSTR